MYVHGFDQSRVQVLIDGVPYYETNYGKLDLAQIPTDNVARIEITKGVASVLSGANALGGTINIISKTAGTTPYTQLRAEGGDWATGRFTATHGQRRGALSYWLNVSGETSGGTPVSGSYEPKVGTIVAEEPEQDDPGDPRGRRQAGELRHRVAERLGQGGLGAVGRLRPLREPPLLRPRQGSRPPRPTACRSS